MREVAKKTSRAEIVKKEYVSDLSGARTFKEIL
jgi:hypothetical protein